MVTKKFDPSKHKRDLFDCNEQSINDFIRKRVKLWTKKNLALCWILEGEQEGSIAGFYTLSATTVTSAQALAGGSKGLPTEMLVPAILISQLGVDVSYQGNGYSRKLLMDAFERALSEELIAWNCIVVDALNERVAMMYEKYGFVRVTENPIRLVIARSTIEQLSL